MFYTINCIIVKYVITLGLPEQEFPLTDLNVRGTPLRRGREGGLFLSLGW